MSRTPDTTKKPALLQQVIDYLIDKPLSALTFRGLASALDVSTFTLVYHFGTRDQLIHDIIGAIATRQRGFETAFDPGQITLDSYLTGLRRTFEQTLEPRNRSLQRLEFEAQMLEALTADHNLTRTADAELEARVRETLLVLGLTDADATVEARLLLDTFYGIQVGLVVSDDVGRATASFDRALTNHRALITSLLSPQGSR